MKNFKKVLALVLVVAMALSFATMSTAAFSDAESIEKTEAVDVLVALGVINGMPDGSFAPEGNVTRAEMAKMLAYILNSGEDVGDMYKGACTFADSANHWAAGYIAYCAQEGLINGKSATTFAPDANVTGTEAAKMILGALGHDGETAGMVGSAWASTALSLAKKANLIGALNNLVCNMNQPLSRQNAAQMLLNGLKATMVEYTGGSKITIGDITMTQGATASDVVAAAGLGYDGINDQLVQLAEEFFGAGNGNLQVRTAQTDVFGRTCNVWTYENELVGAYSVPATLSYNTAVSLHQVYTDLGKVPATELNTITYFVDGVANAGKQALVASDLRSGTVDSLIGGQGVLTEVYFDALTMELNIVEINTYAGVVAAQVDAVVDANGDVVTEAYVQLKNVDGSALSAIAGGAILADGTELATPATVITDAFTKADINKTVVYYTVGSQIYTGGTELPQIQTVAKANEVSGTVKGLAAFAGATTDLTLDATTYKVNASYNLVPNAALIDTAVIAYTDALGNIIYQTGVTAEDYALVLAYGKEQTFTNTVSAQLLFQDGTVKIVTLNALHDCADGTIDSEVPSTNIVTYAAAPDGTYILSAAATEGVVTHQDAQTNVAVENSVATLNGSDFANANTTFTFGVKDNATNVITYSAYTGITAVPSFKAANGNIYYAKNVQGQVAAVFCADAAVLGAASENVVMLYVTGAETLSAVSATNTYYTVAAVVDGAVTSLKVTPTAYGLLNNGINLFDTATTDVNGNYASFGAAVLSPTAVTEFAPYENGVISLNNTPTVVANNLPAYVWNLTTKKLVATTVDALYQLELAYGAYYTVAATLAAPVNAIYAVVK